MNPKVKTKEKQKGMVYFPSRCNLYTLPSSQIWCRCISIVLLRNDHKPRRQFNQPLSPVVPVPSHSVPSGRRIDSRKSIPLPNITLTTLILDERNLIPPGLLSQPRYLAHHHHYHHHNDFTLAATLPLPPPPHKPHPPIRPSLLLG